MKIRKILSRIYVNDIEQAIDFYEKLTGEKCANRFQYKEVSLEIASIGNFLIIAGTSEALKPFLDTTLTILVDSLTEFKKFLVVNGASVIHDIKIVPTGLNITIKHPDGVIVEYVEHR